MVLTNENIGPQAVGTPQRFYDALAFTTVDDLGRHVLNYISTASQHEEIVIRHIQQAWAQLICDRLDQIREDRTVR